MAQYFGEGIDKEFLKCISDVNEQTNATNKQTKTNKQTNKQTSPGTSLDIQESNIFLCKRKGVLSEHMILLICWAIL